MSITPRVAAGACAVLLLIPAARSAPPAKGDPEMGNEVFDEQCSMCHEARSDARKVGPSLKGLFAKDKLESSGKPVTDANVTDQINKGGNGMPSFKGGISDDDMANLLAYLKKL